MQRERDSVYVRNRIGKPRDLLALRARRRQIQRRSEPLLHGTQQRPVAVQLVERKQVRTQHRLQRQNGCAERNGIPDPAAIEFPRRILHQTVGHFADHAIHQTIQTLVVRDEIITGNVGQALADGNAIICQYELAQQPPLDIARPAPQFHHAADRRSRHSCQLAQTDPHRLFRLQDPREQQ